MVKREMVFVNLLSLLFLPVILIYLLYYTRNPATLPVSNVSEMSDIPLKKPKQLLISMCSDHSDKRGYHQNVIAYSLYGITSPEEQNRYLVPLLENVKKVPEFYPGWIIRIYHQMANDDKVYINLTQFVSNFSHVDLCNATVIMMHHNYTNLFPMTWRWFPIMDPTVDLFINRDSDSPILQREVDAVQEWIESHFTYHFMRDHPYHCISIVGGMWGAKVNQSRQLLKKVAIQMFSISHYQHKGYDQELLASYIWPMSNIDMMAHDSYCCTTFPSVPFPTQRQNGRFVNMIEIFHGHSPNMSVCPEVCRPKQHPDWIYC